MAPTNKVLLATAIGHFAIAASHTLKGGAFKDAAFRKIRSALQGQAKAGWYQGSLYFAVMGFINLRWATDGFKGDRIDMAILSLIATTYLGSAAWYVKTGDPATAVVLTPMGLLQIVGALKA